MRVIEQKIDRYEDEGVTLSYVSLTKDFVEIKVIFCPKCKREYLVNVKQFKMQIVNEPDAKTQS